MFKLFKYLKLSEWILIVISIGLIVVQVILDLKMPDYTKELSKMVVAGNITTKDTLINGGYMLLCSLGSLVSSIIVGYLAARVGAGFSYALRDKTFDKVQSFSNEEFNKFQTSSLITRSTNDIITVQSFVTLSLQVLIKAPILAVAAIMKVSKSHIEWTLSVVIGVLLMLILIVIIIATCLPRFKKIQKLTDRLNEVSRENISGIRVVRAFNAENYQEEKFEKANKDITENNLYTGRRMALMMPYMNLIIQIMSLSIYFFGAFIINQAVGLDKLTEIGLIAAFLQYSMQIVMSFMLLIMIFVILPRSLVSGSRINEVLNSKTKIVNGPIKNVEDSFTTIEFINVSFKYPGAQNYVLKNISFKVNKGETIAVIGKTGSGKSTIIDLLERFYDVSEGVILVDNVDIKEYDLNYLHKKIGLVSQKAILFNRTIKENIGYFEETPELIDSKRVEEVLEDANSAQFVSNLELKSDSIVSQGATNLSGGQKQRLSIARALYSKPEILIFDDSFSALDFKTDSIVRNNIRTNYKDISTIIVGQRIGTIKNANQIIVIDSGEIVGIGTHEYLLKNSKFYYDIALTQFEEEELTR